jgi:hypothetical protein
VQVTTFHISTLSSSQRLAVAHPQLPSAAPADDTAEQQGVRRLSSSSSDSSSSGDITGKGQHDLVQTWIVMEYCPKGSLEKTVKLGKLKLPDGQPDMVSDADGSGNPSSMHAMHQHACILHTHVCIVHTHVCIVHTHVCIVHTHADSLIWGQLCHAHTVFLT